jgi:hypothetical protein
MIGNAEMDIGIPVGKELQSPAQIFQNYINSTAVGNIKSKSEENVKENVTGVKSMDIDNEPESSVMNEDDQGLKSMDVDSNETATSPNNEELCRIESSPLFEGNLEKTLEKINIDLPYKSIPAASFSSNNVTILVGVSGCGKSRTCTDICLQRPCLYFEGNLHFDLLWVVDTLKSSSEQGQGLELETKKLLNALFLARIFLLNKLVLENDAITDKNRKMHSYQKSVSFQNECQNLASKLAESDYKALATLTKGSLKGYVVIFDEAQDFMPILEDRYASSQGNYERPLFRFIVGYVHSTLVVPAFYCGTQLRLVDIQMASSAAGGGKTSNVSTFTNFHHYTFEEIKTIIQSAIGASEYGRLAQNDPSSLTKACYYLQGRPRLVTTFCEKLKTEKGSFGEILDVYLDYITNKMAKNVSFKWYWNRVIVQETKVHNFKTGSSQKTPDYYCYHLLIKYLLQAPNNQSCEITLDTDEADLISTALVSLKKVGYSRATYFMLEPVVIEGALNLMAGNSEMEGKFLNEFLLAILLQLETPGLSADAKGKMLDKFIALRFRMGWWKLIPEGDGAWEEIPEGFRNSLRTLEPPKYVSLEGSVYEGMLAMTFGIDTSSTYVLPAEKSGLDGCYRFIGYLGKSCFTKQNNNGDVFVDSGSRKKNLVYTDLNNWFGSIDDREKLIEPFLDLNRSRPFLFLCAELPFYGPRTEELPMIEQIEDTNNWVIHLDLRSRLLYYLLGEVAVKKFSALVSEDQKRLIPQM